MNREEVVRILSVLQTAYPMFYRNQSREQTMNTSNLWCDMFKDRDFQTVLMAVKALIATRTETFPPTIGAVNEMIGKIMEPQLTAMEAWGYVSRALRNGIYGAQEEWEALPESVQKVVSPEQLRLWAIDDNFNEGVASSNFMKSFNAKQQTRKEMNMLPADIRQMAELALNKLNEPRMIREEYRPLLVEYTADKEKPRERTPLRERLENCTKAAGS